MPKAPLNSPFTLVKASSIVRPLTSIPSTETPSENTISFSCSLLPQDTTDNDIMIISASAQNLLEILNKLTIIFDPCNSIFINSIISTIALIVSQIIFGYKHILDT